MIEFSVNHTRANLDVDPSTPLLWVIRDHLGLTGTKYGLAGNICRCGTYPRIRQAIHRAAGTVAKGGAR